MNLNAIPGLSRELLDALDNLYPEKCPDIKDSERAIWLYSGKRELVRHLYTVLERQEKEAKNAGSIASRSTADRLAGL